MITEKFVQPSADAVNLSKQIAQNSKSEVRSLMTTTPNQIQLQTA